MIDVAKQEFVGAVLVDEPDRALPVSGVSLAMTSISLSRIAVRMR